MPNTGAWPATIDVDALLAGAANGSPRAQEVLSLDGFRRVRLPLETGGEALVDTFPQAPGHACGYVRLPPDQARSVSLTFPNVDGPVPCAAGGWLLRASGDGTRGAACYWIPQPPALRTLDTHGRILSQKSLPLPQAMVGDAHVMLAIDVPAQTHLDLTVWRFAPDGGTNAGPGVLEALDAPLALERQRWFLRSSHAAVDRIGDLYRCLVHGAVYDNRFVKRPRFPDRTWRVCSENEAYSLYMLLSGLELATGRPLYSLLKHQIVGSIIARQASDGGWYHGEWTDLMESHFRLHAAGVLVLEAAFEQTRDPAVGQALQRAAAFLAGRTDSTAFGPWFLHDGLEESVERATAEGAPVWEPTRCLGAGPANKLILNSHLDAIVTLDRYRELTGDDRHAATVEAARGTAMAVLTARPAERLYRLAYAAVRLTLLPKAGVAKLSPPLKAVRRLARSSLLPNLYRLKWRHPRFVMPGGMIDRHLAPKHFNTGYHTVNLMDVVRLMRRVPGDALRTIARDAVRAVTATGLLQHWVETKRVQPIGYWLEAIYQLCTLDPAPEYRAWLAGAMLAAEDLGIGLPPTLLGADPEVIPQAQQTPCPSPRDARLRVASLCRGSRREVVVVNLTRETIPLEWETRPLETMQWTSSEPRSEPQAGPAAALVVAARGWLVGNTMNAEDDGPSVRGGGGEQERRRAAPSSGK
jgi:hypothetical protein